MTDCATCAPEIPKTPIKLEYPAGAFQDVDKNFRDRHPIRNTRNHGGNEHDDQRKLRAALSRDTDADHDEERNQKDDGGAL